MTLLSICVPTWNGAALLERTLGSLLAQDLGDFELIVGDDGSTDATLEVARGVADRRLSVHAFPERRGLGANWNRTLALARGRYAVLAGQDDEWAPAWASRLVGLLERHPGADLAFCRRRIALHGPAAEGGVGLFFRERYPLLLQPFLDAVGEVIEPGQMLDHACRHCFELNLIGEPSFAIFRRRSPAAAGGFDERLPQLLDWEFFTRFFVDRPLLFAREELGVYHLHAQAESLRNSARDHYPEVHRLQGIALERFGHLLGDERRRALEGRRAEIARLAGLGA